MNSARNFDLLILGRCAANRVEPQLSKYKESTVDFRASSESCSGAALKISFIFTDQKSF